MARWRPDGAERLEQAAAELFAEQGYDATSVDQIARRAGLTQRTFYNHFADKRDVLFGLSEEFAAQTVAAFQAGEHASAPLDRVVRALASVCDAMFTGRRPAVVRRQGIIAANRELGERDLTKQAALRDALAAMLHQTGLDRDSSMVTAGAGLLVQEMAIRSWVQPAETRRLSELMVTGLYALRTEVGRTSPDSDAS